MLRILAIQRARLATITWLSGLKDCARPFHGGGRRRAYRRARYTGRSGFGSRDGRGPPHRPGRQAAQRWRQAANFLLARYSCHSARSIPAAQQIRISGGCGGCCLAAHDPSLWSHRHPMLCSVVRGLLLALAGARPEVFLWAAARVCCRAIWLPRRAVKLWRPLKRIAAKPCACCRRMPTASRLRCNIAGRR